MNRTKARSTTYYVFSAPCYFLIATVSCVLVLLSGTLRYGLEELVDRCILEEKGAAFIMRFLPQADDDGFSFGIYIEQQRVYGFHRIARIAVGYSDDFFA